MSESESELIIKGSKEFAAGLVMRWAKDWAEDDVASTCEEGIDGDGWRTLLRRECPCGEGFLEEG